MTTAAERLKAWAKEAIADYHAQVKEGEPPYPQAAADVLERERYIERLEAQIAQLMQAA